MMGIGELATVGVTLLTTKGVEAIGSEAGKRMIGELWDKVKAKLTGRDALADFEASPDDGDTQAALRVQLKKALEDDPAFKDEVAKLVGELDAKGGPAAINMSATITGDQGKIAQVAGDKNQVTM